MARIAGSPPVRRRNMFSKWTCLARLPIEVLSVSSFGHCIIFPEHASFPQLRQEQFDDILE